MTSHVYVIAGPNAAEKTTLIAGRLSPVAPESVAITAGRLMLQKIEALAKQQADLGYETTLAGRGHLNLIRDLKRRGYEVHFFYLWLPSVELAISTRVKERVLRGGHDIPIGVIRRRFDRSFRNFWNYYRPAADEWTLFDSEHRPVVVASQARSVIQIAEQTMYNAIVGSI